MISAHLVSAFGPGTTGRVATRLESPCNLLVLLGFGVVAIIIGHGAGVS